ncbi:hypothetical protein TrRE_jg10012 [Triparma retinervis]|uniref:Sphingomyelin synthase-like domain-containing protein n=1 Tax=Triparma retinervis TaxID=2557542 RepID=A0A9W7E7B8_9STRA|nr:hypothetical protein TrRE_jg10012 [Triparma retinervis]
MKMHNSAVLLSQRGGAIPCAPPVLYELPPSTHITPTAGAVYPYPFPLPSLRNVFLTYTFFGFVYLFTLQYNDALFHKDPRPPLKDLGFHHFPCLPLAGEVCDVFATIVIFTVAGYLFYTGDLPAFRWGLLDLAVGKLVSLTLHSSTLMPESRSVIPEPTPVIGRLMGGSTDRLMSNHVFELGVALHIAQGLGWIRSTPERLAVLLIFSAGIILSRGHYTVDVVLAWWCMAVVGRLGFKYRKSGEV